MKQNKKIRKDFEAKVLSQLDALYRTAIYVLDDESQAQDLVRESFIKAYQCWQELQYSPDCRVWLFKIMANIIIRKYRISYSPSIATNIANEIDEYLPQSKWISQSLHNYSGQVSFSAISERHVRKAIKDLPEDYRLIVVLSLLENFSYREIAGIASIDIKTVSSRICHGRQIMQRKLFDYVERDGNYAMSADSARRRSSG